MGRPRTSYGQSQHSQAQTLRAGLYKQKGLFLASLVLGNASLNLQPCTAYASSSRELVDRIVVEVSATPILLSEVEAKVARGPLVNISAYPALPEDPPYRQALEDAINLQLVLDAAKALEIEVSEADIDEQIQHVLTQNNIDLEQLKQVIAEQGKDFADYRADIHNQLVFMRFRGRVLMASVKLTARDVERYYLRKVGSTTSAASVTLRKIFFSLPAGSVATVKAEKEKLAGEVYSKLKNGMDFMEAEKIYSELADGREGRPGMKARLQDLDEGLRKAVQGLDEKGFTEPLPIGGGLYIFYLEEKKFAVDEEFLAQKANLELELRQQQMNEQLNLWLKAERQKSKIKYLEAQ